MNMLPFSGACARLLRATIVAVLCIPAGSALADEGMVPVKDILSQERRLLMALGSNRAKKIAGVSGKSILRIASVSRPKDKKRPKLRKEKLSKINSFRELNALPRATGGAEWACLTEALYFEARGESFKGIAAVAEVIVNRAKSRKFPGSICAVISQGVGGKPGCQFSYKCDGHAEVFREKNAYARVAKMARAKLDDRLPHVTGGALYYHTTAVKPRWSRKFRRTARVGVHLFYNPS